MNPRNLFAELTPRNGYKIAKSCFLLGWWSRSPGWKILSSVTSLTR